MMGKVINAPIAKNMSDLEKVMNEWEDNLHRFEVRIDTQWDEDLKVHLMINMCPPKLRDHLNLTTDDKDYQEIRKEIIRMIEIERNNNGPKPMDVGNINHRCDHNMGSQMPLTYQAQQESYSTYLNYINDQYSHGNYETQLYNADYSNNDGYENNVNWEGNADQPSDIDAISTSVQCYNCKGYGHRQNECPTPKGKGKGKGQYGKGDTKGGGKYGGKNGGKDAGKGGKNPNYIPYKGPPCEHCGKPNHSTDRCWAKAKGKGKGDTNSIDEQVVELGGFELCSVEINETVRCRSRMSTMCSTSTTAPIRHSCRRTHQTVHMYVGRPHAREIWECSQKNLYMEPHTCQ